MEPFDDLYKFHFLCDRVEIRSGDGRDGTFYIGPLREVLLGQETVIHIKESGPAMVPEANREEDPSEMASSKYAAYTKFGRRRLVNQSWHRRTTATWIQLGMFQVRWRVSGIAGDRNILLSRYNPGPFTCVCQPARNEQIQKLTLRRDERIFASFSCRYPWAAGGARALAQGQQGAQDGRPSSSRVREAGRVGRIFPTRRLHKSTQIQQKYNCVGMFTFFGTGYKFSVAGLAY